MAFSFDSPCVLVLGLPAQAFCGIDLVSFTTSPKFRGVKDLSPGWHFVFASATNSFSLRHGAWFQVQEPKADSPPELFVLKWAADREELEPETDFTEILRLRANIGSMWNKGLLAYTQSAKSVEEEEEKFIEERFPWEHLTDCITQSLLDRIIPSESSSHHERYWILTSAGSAVQDADAIPGLNASEGNMSAEEELKFLTFNLKQTWREGAIGRERTDAAQDRSWLLEQVMSVVRREPTEIIGEMQLCFVMVLTLNNNSCLEQWKRLLCLLLTCKAAPAAQPSFFATVLSNLRLQLEHCQDVEGGIFDLSNEGTNLIKVLLKRFRDGLDTISGPGKFDVIDELDELEDYMREEHGWFHNDLLLKHGLVELEDGERVELDMVGADAEDETGEYAPVLVDLTPEQLQALHGDTAVHLPAKERLARTSRGLAREEQDSSDDGDERSHVDDLDERY